MNTKTIKQIAAISIAVFTAVTTIVSVIDKNK
jgi:hypothetical protein